MHKLPLAKRVQILALMVEGSSMRAISRVCAQAGAAWALQKEDCLALASRAFLLARNIFWKGVHFRLQGANL